MDYGKIDADLAFALEEADPASEDPVFSVFVRTTGEPSPGAEALLGSLGVRNPEPGSRVYTADLSSQGVAELSRQPWVRSLTLSRTLRPLRRVP
jgi:hypothetical protein